MSAATDAYVDTQHALCVPVADDDLLANTSGALLPIEFRSDKDNAGERRSMILSGYIADKAIFLRDAILLIFRDKVQEQQMFFHIELMSAETTIGPPLLERAKALEALNTVVCMGNVGELDGAIVVRVPQVTEHPEWNTWLDTPQDPHITLAVLGEKEMEDLPVCLKSLVFLVLRGLAKLGVRKPESYLVREEAVRLVWNYMNLKDFLINTIETMRVFDRVKKLLKL